MQSDEPFPLERVTLRARKAILQVFGGRHPSILEVTKVSDSHWLTKPGVGPATLEQISHVTRGGIGPTNLPCAPQLSDAELMKRLDRLQRELLRLQKALEDHRRLFDRRPMPIRNTGLARDEPHLKSFRVTSRSALYYAFFFPIRDDPHLIEGADRRAAAGHRSAFVAVDFGK